MEQLQLLRAKLFNTAEGFSLGPQSKDLLKNFSEQPNCLEKPQEAFVAASLLSGLAGPESLVLASRLKCEHIIKGVLASMDVECDIDSITPILMSPPKEKE